MSNDNGKYRWWAKGDSITEMNGFREILIEETPFRVFQIYCNECEESLIKVSDLTESPFKNEVLVLYRIRTHAKETGHCSFDGNIEPMHALQHIDTNIHVQNV
jgi:hypothetical protein